MRFRLIETVSTEASPPPLDDQSCDTTSGSGFYRGGYADYERLGAMTMQGCNVCLALLFILCGLPIFVLLGLIIKCTDGGPILYRGIRLGRCKVPFYMYKFRTLPEGSQKSLGAMLVSDTNIRLNPLVRLLRDVRLDELPQLFNIVKGDMDFVGPRPIRPEIYEAACRNIPNFDLRFSVRPGLIGFSQLFTPHSTPKRLRAFIDNKFLLLKRKFYWDIFIIFYTILILAKRIISRGLAMVCRAVKKRLSREAYAEKRALQRQSPDNVCVDFWCPQPMVAAEKLQGELIDINEAYCRIDSNCKLDGTELVFSLARMLKSRNKWRQYKRKKAYCRGIIYKTLQNFNPNYLYTYIVEYQAVSPFYSYVIDKYFLNKSIM